MPLREAIDAVVAYGRPSPRGTSPWKRYRAAAVGLRSTEGNPLDRLSVRKILSNVSYMGQVAHHARRGGGVVAKGKHPAIVDAALFAAVQETLAEHRRYTPPIRPFGREPYPLSGVGVCGPCGATLLGCASVVLRRYRYTYYRCSTAQRRGREACRQPMVRTEVLEAQMAAYVGGMQLPPEYLGAVVAELRRRHKNIGADPGQAERLRRELDRWRRLFVLGEIDEARLKRETAPLKRTLGELERPQEVLDVEKAVNYLRDVGRLWAESPRRLQREFVREVFDRIIVEGREVVAITPKLTYAPLFVLDRRERFGQKGPDFCSMAPRAGIEPTT